MGHPQQITRQLNPECSIYCNLRRNLCSDLRYHNALYLHWRETHQWSLGETKDPTENVTDTCVSSLESLFRTPKPEKQAHLKKRF